MTDRVALVTGGARGIGRAIALRLAADVDSVVVNYFRSSDAARETVGLLRSTGVQAHAIRASVARPEQRVMMFAELRDRFGRLDILVNSAADGALGPVIDVTEAQLDRAFATNVKGALACALEAASLMEPGSGSIVNVSTLGGGQLVMANYLACAPAKAGLEALTRYLAVELAPRGIRVNTAASGLLRSSVADQFPDAERMQEAVRRATPFGRLGLPEELAEVVAFLASPRASWITGQTVLADGGLSTGAALLSPSLQAADAELAQPGRDQHLTTVAPPVHLQAETAPAASVSERDVETAVTATRPDDIVIVGMGLAVPGASSPADFADLLINGTDMMTPVPGDRWDNSTFWCEDGKLEDKTYSAHSGFITDLQPHPQLHSELAGRAGTPGAPTHLEQTTLWLRHSLMQALDGVTIRPHDRCSFVIGYTADGSQYLEEATVRAAVATRLGAHGESGSSLDDHARARVESAVRQRYPRTIADPLDVQPHRVAPRAMQGLLPDGTETIAVDTACSSSLYSLDIGLLGLLDDRHDVAVCGGAFAVGPRGSVLFSKLNGLSRRGQVRSLDESADGVLFSDGAGVVVLKRRARAEQDGDRILATVRSFGASSDGKGKAIYAPSPLGQRIAVDRAFADPDVQRPDWVVAHATGTPAGDLAELTSLGECFADGPTVYVTSNKSVIGHTGWAAGVASIVHAVESLRRGTIAPQAQFAGRRPLPSAADRVLAVPSRPVDWPPAGGKRTVAISGFGFGGTNAHLILAEPEAASAATVRRPETPTEEATGDRLTVVAAATHVPGQSDDELVRTAAAAPSFGDSYPLPPFSAVRMPPGTLRAIDRCQLMILQCSRRILDELGEVWAETRDTTGVVVGHAGATRNAMLYATRCYADDLRVAVAPVGPQARGAVDDLVHQVRELCPPSSEDTFPGMMPNVIAARVANYYDLHGPNMTIDTGLTSALTAVDVAARYLRAGRMDMALVGGINGNSTPELAHLVAPVIGTSGVLAEGGFMVALTTERHARTLGLEVLAYLEDGVEQDDAAGRPASTGSTTVTTVRCGAERGGRAECYLGGEGLLALVEVLQRPAAERLARIECTAEDGARGRSLRVFPPLQPESSGPIAGPPRGRRASVDWDADDVVRRSEVRLRPSTTVPVAGDLWAHPASTVVLTDDARLLSAAHVPGGVRVVQVGGPTPERPDADHLAEVTEAGVEQLMARATIHHVRVLTRLDPQVRVSNGLLDLHDALFLTAKCLAAQDDGQGPGAARTMLALLLQGLADERPHPAVGLFTGLLKVVRLEGIAPTAVVVATETTDPAAGLAAAAGEIDTAHPAPLVLVGSAGRLSPTAVPAPLPRRPSGALARDSVVVAVGGGRGITAELLVALARDSAPTTVVLGSNPLDAHPQDLMGMSEQAFAAARPAYIKRRRSEDPQLRVADINHEFERIAQARAVGDTLATLRQLCGLDRVDYIRCDITSAEDVSEALDQVHRTHGTVSLLVHAAGLNRSATIADKTLREFRRIRDLKVRGHDNLADALRDRPPGLWVNFGSLLGLTGQVGEADYASANDYLGMAALSRTTEVAPETTLGWTLWGDVGLGADELTKAYFDKAGLYSSMGTAEGIRHFLREIAQVRPHAYTVHMGQAEESAVRRLLPGFLEQSEDPGSSQGERAQTDPEPARAGPPFYLNRIVEATADQLVAERVFDEETDSYLQGHLVQGRPTLPGAFVAELAVEAARHLRPDLIPTAVTNLTLDHFLKVGPRSAPRRIVARVVRKGADGADISVRVSEDVVTPSGQVLVRDRQHFAATVEMRRSSPPPAAWRPWPDTEAQEVPDPYHAAGSPVLLRAEFRSTTRTRVVPEGARAAYTAPVGSGHPVYGTFSVPVLLIDGLLRTGVLEVVHERYVPVCAPLRIGRLELFETVNDTELGHRCVELFVARESSPSEGRGAGTTRFVATDNKGNVVLQILDLEWVLLGYIDNTTGHLVTAPDTSELSTTGEQS